MNKKYIYIILIIALIIFIIYQYLSSQNTENILGNMYSNLVQPNTATITSGNNQTTFIGSSY